MIQQSRNQWHASASLHTHRWHHDPAVVERPKPLAWNVTVPDTYADAHVSNTAIETAAAASLAATNKTNKCSQQSTTHIFSPVANETAGTLHHQTVEMVQELGRRATDITGDSRETT